MRRETTRALPGAPVPYPDEALYGAFARTGLYLGVASPKTLAFKLFGSRGALAVPDLPSRLSEVFQWADKEWGSSPVGLLLGHTSLAYHTHLHGRAVFEQYTAALQAPSCQQASNFDQRPASKIDQGSRGYLRFLNR